MKVVSYFKIAIFGHKISIYFLWETISKLMPFLFVKFGNYSGNAPSGRDGRKKGVCAGRMHSAYSCLNE